MPFCIDVSSLHFYITNNQSWPEVQLGWLALWHRAHLFIDTFMVFLTFEVDQLVKIRRHHCKKGLKTRKGPEFDSDLWENNKDIAMQSRKVSSCLYGG